MAGDKYLKIAYELAIALCATVGIIGPMSYFADILFRWHVPYGVISWEFIAIFLAVIAILTPLVPKLHSLSGFKVPKSHAVLALIVFYFWSNYISNTAFFFTIYYNSFFWEKVSLYSYLISTAVLMKIYIAGLTFPNRFYAIFNFELSVLIIGGLTFPYSFIEDMTWNQFFWRI